MATNTTHWHNNPLLALVLMMLFFVLFVFLDPMKYAPYKEIRTVALIATLTILVVTLMLWFRFDYCDTSYQFVTQIPLIKEYNLMFSLGLDGISLVFILLTAFIIPICIFALADGINLKQYIKYLLLIEFCLIVSFLTTNLLVFYIFFESVLIPVFLMIGLWGARDRKMNAAYYFFLYTLFGSFFLLFGMLYLYTIAESLEYQVLLNLILSDTEQIGLWLCFFIPFAVKVPMFPFHLWLPEAHVEAPTIGSVLLASLLLKLGGYGILRFTIPLCPEGTSYFVYLVVLLTITSIIFASFSALRQSDLKRVIAYSSIAHMNLIVLGLFTGTVQGIDGAIYLMVGHGFVSAALFFCVGVLYDRYHTRAIKHYSGLVVSMPLFSIFFFLFTLGNMGFPGTSNFVGEFLIFVGIFSASPIICGFAATSIVLGAIYSIFLFNRIVFGTIKVGIFADLNRREFIILTILALAMLVLGLKSTIITDITWVSVLAINEKG